MQMSDINFEIKKHIAVLNEKANGWKKELNLVSWGGRDAKYDIRDWSEDHAKMSKGITLSADEIDNLREALYDI